MDEVHLDLAVDPSALVTASRARDAFERVLPEPLGRLPYVVTTPVTLEVVCPTRPSPQRGLVEYPNIDRWLRPLTDALAGAERLLLAGSQVMTVNVRTAAPSTDQRRLSIRVTSVNAQRVLKADLRRDVAPDVPVVDASVLLDRLPSYVPVPPGPDNGVVARDRYEDVSAVAPAAGYRSAV